MSTFHITSALRLYDALQLPSTSVSDMISRPLTADGSIFYVPGTGTKPIGGALAISIPNGGNGYVYRYMYNDVSVGEGLVITTSRSDPGFIKFDLASTGGKGNGIKFTRINISSDRSSVTSSGICYGNVGTNLSNGFIYNIYKTNSGEKIDATVTVNSTNSNYVTINFGSLDKFVQLSSAVTVDIYAATSAPTIVGSVTTVPAL